MPGFSPLLIIFIIINRLYADYPNDEYYNSKQRVSFEAIRIPDAWEKLKGAKRRLQIIAILDSGVDSYHPDLFANMLPGYNAVENNTDAHDREGHGTLVAGVVGALINNEMGVAGITEHIRLMPIYDGKCYSNDYFASGIEFAVKAGVDVILFAGGLEMPLGIRSWFALKSASESGIQVICAAGNDGRNISKSENRVWPCAYAKTIDGVLCVAATDQGSLELRQRSNYAPFIDVAAPGNLYSTKRNGGYEAFKGTSPAAAVVAGVVAMMKSISPQPLSAAKVKSIIKQSSTPGVRRGGEEMAFGRVDALKAVKLAWHG